MANQVVLERREKVAKLADKLGPKQISLKLDAPYSTIRNDLQVIRKANLQGVSVPHVNGVPLNGLQTIGLSLKDGILELDKQIGDLREQRKRMWQALRELLG